MTWLGRQAGGALHVFLGGEAAAEEYAAENVKGGAWTIWAVDLGGNR